MHSPELGDYIGVESCVDLRSDVFDNPPVGGERSHPPRRRRRRETAAKEYPPPIPWLARTENHPWHMPWVMKRYHTSDGRLLIREEKAERHEYFQAHRSNGRLVLNLVPLDDAVEESCGEQQEEDSTDNIRVSDEVIDGGDKGTPDLTVEEVFSDCYKYSSLGGVVNPCGGFGVALPLQT